MSEKTKLKTLKEQFEEASFLIQGRDSNDELFGHSDYDYKAVSLKDALKIVDSLVATIKDRIKDLGDKYKAILVDGKTITTEELVLQAAIKAYEEVLARLGEKEKQSKVIILDNNPLSIACYMEEFGDKFSEKKEKQKP